MNNLIPIERNGQRVLTTAQLAESYGTDTNTLTVNFSRNKERYTEGKHFIMLEGESLKAFKSDLTNCNVATNVNRLYLWTEKGAWLHAKSLNTDKAWEAYEMLIDDYYRKQQASNPKQLIALALIEAHKMLEEKDMQIAIMQPKAEFFDQVADSADAIDIGTAAKVLKIPGIGRNNLFDILRNKNILMQDNKPYQRFIDNGYFRVIEQKYTKPDGSTHISIKTLVYQKGLEFIRKTITK